MINSKVKQQLKINETNLNDEFTIQEHNYHHGEQVS